MIRFLSFKSLINRKFISFLCILSIALSLALFLLVEKLRRGVEEGFTNAISNADLIVGARSGPLQLLLYSVFHIGSPTNNIRYSSFEDIKNDPSVEWTIPISLGDSYKGHRVVATNEDFYKNYQFRDNQHLKISKGSWGINIFDVVLGSQVASKQKLDVSSSIVLSHGISQTSILDHDNTPFKVIGILKPTGTPLDKSVFITLEGMEAIHLGWSNGVPNYDDETDYSKIDKSKLHVEQLTSFIIRTKNRFGLLHLNRSINNYEKEPLIGIIPAMALTELWSLLDQVEKAFLGISFFVIGIGFLSILISLYMSLNERQREMAILRSIGVSAREITFMLLTEAAILSLMGALFGFVMQYLALSLLKPILENEYSLYIPVGAPTIREFVVIILFIVLGAISGLIPAVKAYRTSLNSGLMIK